MVTKSPSLVATPAFTGVSIKVGATEEIVAARTTQLAIIVVEFVAAARAPAPVFALGLSLSGVFNRFRIWQQAMILVRVGGHSKLFT